MIEKPHRHLVPLCKDKQQKLEMLTSVLLSGQRRRSSTSRTPFA